MATRRSHQKPPAQLFLWSLLDPARPTVVGELKHMRNGDCSLTYEATWLAAGFALSPDLPLAQDAYAPVHHHVRQSGAPGAVDDARPDRWGEKLIRYLYKPAATVYDHLYFAGHERFGALGVSDSKDIYTPFGGTTLPRLQDAPAISAAIRIIESGVGELDDQMRALVSAGGSLGGAKPKAAISIGSQEFVIKFYNAEPFDQPLVEHATMELARAAGLDVARTQLIQLSGEHAVAVERFDRAGAQRVHCISACTLLRSMTPGGQDPEFGYPQLARALKQFADIQTLNAQLRELFKRMIFNILIANTDDHEKNHSLMCTVSGRTMRMTLSKAYDIVPTGSGATEHQFFISETRREPNLDEAMSVCGVFNLTPPEAAADVAEIIAKVNGWKSFFAGLGVTARDFEELEPLIDSEGLLAQRMGFDSTQYDKAKPARKKRVGARVFRA